MGFSDRQMRALARSVPSRNIRTRVSAGKELTYIEGWYALAQANRIFGFDGWDRETVETKCLLQRESRGHYSAVYSARVRITVRADDAVIIRDGHGTGEAHGDSAGEVHDRALKAAETDATKRALATFGKAFGLALYASGGRLSGLHARNADKKKSLAAGSGQPPAPKSPRADPARPGNEAARPEASARSRAHLVAHAEDPTGEDRNDLADREAGADRKVNNRTGGSASGAEVPLSSGPGASQRQGQTDALTGPATEIDQIDQSRIDKSALALAEPNRIRDKDHLRFVAAQPCLLCSAVPCDAHHLRFSQPRALGRKVGDEFTVPLCRKHHRDLHDSGNEAAWWHDMGIDAIEIAKDLWNESLTARLKARRCWRR